MGLVVGFMSAAFGWLQYSATTNKHATASERKSAHIPNLCLIGAVLSAQTPDPMEGRK